MHSSPELLVVRHSPRKQRKSRSASLVLVFFSRSETVFRGARSVCARVQSVLNKLRCFMWWGVRLNSRLLLAPASGGAGDGFLDNRVVGGGSRGWVGGFNT